MYSEHQAKCLKQLGIVPLDLRSPDEQSDFGRVSETAAVSSSTTVDNKVSIATDNPATQKSVSKNRPSSG